jgi:hypothetical protein
MVYAAHIPSQFRVLPKPEIIKTVKADYFFKKQIFMRLGLKGVDVVRTKHNEVSILK